MADQPPALPDDWVAALDQIKKTLRDCAVHSYYAGLIEAGFSEKQALYLAACWTRAPEPPPE